MSPITSLQYQIAVVATLLAVGLHLFAYMICAPRVAALRRQLKQSPDLHDLAAWSNALDDSDSARSSLLYGTAIWFEFITVTSLAAAFDSAATYGLAAVAVGIRMRALQEVAHVLVHAASRRWWVAADCIAQIPLGRTLSSDRYVRHVRLHHGHGTLAVGDPHRHTVADWQRRLAKAPEPAQSSSASRLLYLAASSISPHVVLSRATTSLVPRPFASVSIFRPALFLLPAIWIWLVTASMGKGLGVWLVAVWVVYPTISWCSELIEHRWAAVGEVLPNDPVQRELFVGVRIRPTNAIESLLLRVLQPYGERYHLVHSIAQGLNPRELAIADEILSVKSVEYQSAGSSLTSCLQDVSSLHRVGSQAGRTIRTSG